MTACTHDKHLPKIPKETLQCDEWPSKLKETFSDKDLAYWIIDGHAAWDSCYSKIANIRQALGR